MKSEFKAKFLGHLLNRKDNQGFTLIELLVVIIIIGILSAIALPSFLNQASKAKQSEAKNYIGAVQRAQQSYRIENKAFGTSVDALQIGIPTQTDNYTYGFVPGGNDVTRFIGKTLDATALKSFASGVVVLTSGQTSAISCQTKLTETKAPVVATELVLDTSAGASCGTNLENMK